MKKIDKQKLLDEFKLMRAEIMSEKAVGSIPDSFLAENVKLSLNKFKNILDGM
jgi:hypothetical protein